MAEAGAEHSDQSGGLFRDAAWLVKLSAYERTKITQLGADLAGLLEKAQEMLRYTSRGH